METAQGPPVDNGDSSPLKKWAPLGVLAVIVAVVIGIVLSNGGDDEPADGAGTSVAAGSDQTSDSGSTSSDTTGAATSETSATDTASGTTSEATSGDPAAPGDSGLPEGVMTFSVAEELGLDIDFGDRCDPETGRVRVESLFAPECFAPFDGDNGGATAAGVTEDSIKVVYWQSQEDDLVLKYITDAIDNDDTNADIADTIDNLTTYYETYYEMYGRSIDLIFYEGSGLINDGVSGRADAVAIAEEHDPFMVIGGPSLTNTFAEELAAREIPCIGCGPGQPHDFYRDNAPYAWTLGLGPEQANMVVAEWANKQLVGRPAEFAGDESMHDTERVFGRLWINSSDTSIDLNEQFEDEFTKSGGVISESIPYVLDPGTIQESASTAIARLKNAGVTTVILSVDPVAPRDFTREASQQNYFPEWVLGGNVLADTSVFARTYEQDQWKNAFGPTTLSMPVTPELSGARTIYRWFHGEDPAANSTIGVLDPSFGLFYATIQGAGPELTAETWQSTLFDAEPTASRRTAPSISYGSENRWPADIEPDYRGVDDMTLIWWDPNQVGIDELDQEGPGMWQYIDGGTRFLLGEVPDEAAGFFNAEGSVDMLFERPADEQAPAYDPIPPG